MLLTNTYIWYIIDSIAILTIPVLAAIKAPIAAKKIGVDRRMTIVRKFIVNNEPKIVLSIFL